MQKITEPENIEMRLEGEQNLEMNLAKEIEEEENIENVPPNQKSIPIIYIYIYSVTPELFPRCEMHPNSPPGAFGRTAFLGDRC